MSPSNPEIRATSQPTANAAPNRPIKSEVSADHPPYAAPHQTTPRATARTEPAYAAPAAPESLRRMLQRQLAGVRREMARLEAPKSMAQETRTARFNF